MYEEEAKRGGARGVDEGAVVACSHVVTTVITVIGEGAAEGAEGEAGVGMDGDGVGVSVQLNLELQSVHAQLRVEVLDRHFQPVSGLSGRSSLPLTMKNAGGSLYSAFREEAKWTTASAVAITSSLRAFRLRVVFEGVRPQDAKLYAIYAQLRGQGVESVRLGTAAI
jgi:hypothetical protein